MPLSIYLASSLKNIDRAKQLRDRLIMNGFIISYNWLAHGEIPPDKDLQPYALAELNGVKSADLLFILLPGRCGTYFEFGCAYALNKPIIILNDNNYEALTSFDYLPGLHKFTDEKKAISLLHKIARSK